MDGWVATVETGSFSMDCLRFGRGDDVLVILPGASVVSVMAAADAIEEAYAPLAEVFTVYLFDYRRDFPDPYFVRAVTVLDITGELDRIACPALAIGSSDDRMLGAEGTLQIAGRLGGRPGFETFMYDGYGHAAYDTAPDYKERMLRFLAA